MVFPLPPKGSRLVFESNFDGPLDPYLDALLQAAPGLDAIYQCCRGYPGAAAGPEAVKAYLRSIAVRPSAYHIGNPGRSVAASRRQAALAERIETFLDGHVPAGGAAGGATQVRAAIQAFVDGQPDLAWAHTVIPRLTAAQRIGPYLPFVGAGLAVVALALVSLPLFLVLLAAFLVVFGAWLAWLRRLERRDRPPADPASALYVEKLLGREDRIVQNHLASITTVKAGWFRRWTLRIVLFVARLAARTANKGELSGIPSIHFAHWSLLDGGRTLLFLSNYDGSWENYLDDFIDKASTGLTGIWSNTEGFPATRFLTRGGARDGPAFKEWARYNQTYTNAWYSAYPRLTVQRIDQNSSIQEGLFASLAEDEARPWLGRL